MNSHALAEVLQISEPTADIGFVFAIRNGLPCGGIEALSSKLKLTINELSEYLHVSAKTLQRHKGKLLSPNVSDRLFRIAQVYARCEEVFGNEEAAALWLKEPIGALNGEKPINYLDTSMGTEIVMTILGRIEYGVYS